MTTPSRSPTSRSATTSRPEAWPGRLSRLDERGAVAIAASAALLALYASDPAAVSGELGLIAADPATANVVLAVPQDGDILPAADVREPAVAPVALVVADLLTLPGRSDAEAEQLMDALAATDQAWEE